MTTKEIILKRAAFWATTATAIGLGIAGFITPPRGVIDASVVQFGSLLFGFGCVAQIPVVLETLKQGGNVKITHGNTSVEVSKNDDNLLKNKQ